MLNNGISVEDLHPACVKCIAERQVKFGPDYNKLKCDGIKNDVLSDIDTTSMDDGELDTARYLLDPWYWGKKEFAIHQRDAQEVMTKCTAKRKVFRIGRRWGKTQVLVLAAIHRMMVTKNLKVLLFTPYENQIELFFLRVKEWMDLSPALAQSVSRIVGDPFTMELGNGSYLKGFTTGTKSGNNAGSSRGQEADIIIIDEADLLSRADLTAILPMLQRTNEFSTKEKELWVASTPTGKHDFFYDWCRDSLFKEFHFPSSSNPAWNEEEEATAHALFPNPIDYDHEYNAEFGEEMEGVYQHAFVDRAVDVSKEFFTEGIWDYKKQAPQNGCLYMIGVDWNAAGNGTQIVVVEYNPQFVSPKDVETGILARFRVVTREAVDAKEFTQTKSVNKLVELNRRWNPEKIYVDEGYGMTQIEQLKTYGKLNPDSNILHRLEPINFSSMQEIVDPQTKQLVKKHMKPFLVFNTVGYFEKNLMMLNKSDSFLEKQIRDYQIEKRSRDGRPVFSEGNDHTLQALHLAMLGFTMITDLGRRTYTNRVGAGGRLGEKKSEQIIEDDGTIKIIDNANKNRGIVKPRQIATTDREGNRIQRAWKNNRYSTLKNNRPIKRSI